MGVYINRDIEVDDDGDIVVNPSGDIGVADTAESMKHAIKFMLATDYNEVKPHPLMGANLGSLIGRHDINEVVEDIPGMVVGGNTYSALINSSDIRVTAIPIDVDKIYVSVELTGVYLDAYGHPLDVGVTYLEYIFPYTEEKIQDLT